MLLIDVPPSEGRLISWLHDTADLIDSKTGDDGTLHVNILIDPQVRGKLDGLLKRAGLESRKPRPPRPRRRCAAEQGSAQLLGMPGV